MTNNGKNTGELVEEIKKALVKLMKEMGCSLANVKEAFKQISLDTLLQAWNYTEVNQDKYSFKELLNWVKQHLKPNFHSGASITKEEKAGVIILSCCLMDKNNMPMTSPKDPFLRVITKELDEDLKKNFGDKNVIVLC
ncbi:hypothetical protein [Helicobacter ailurogastricus]|uniref:hypothetical protein n=1 Tax=Helicobacter ailurogastricus TaxID=1578720 RepID=UPI000CF1AFA1|nr:hypothetical protein [Helicobacter ailurogastricus]